jgi:hypothetical protein
MTQSSNINHRVPLMTDLGAVPPDAKPLPPPPLELLEKETILSPATENLLLSPSSESVAAAAAAAAAPIWNIYFLYDV